MIQVTATMRILVAIELPQHFYSVYGRGRRPIQLFPFSRAGARSIRPNSFFVESLCRISKDGPQTGDGATGWSGQVQCLGQGNEAAPRVFTPYPNCANIKSTVIARSSVRTCIGVFLLTTQVVALAQRRPQCYDFDSYATSLPLWEWVWQDTKRSLKHPFKPRLLNEVDQFEFEAKYALALDWTCSPFGYVMTEIDRRKAGDSVIADALKGSRTLNNTQRSALWHSDSDPLVLCTSKLQKKDVQRFKEYFAKYTTRNSTYRGTRDF